MRHRVHKGFTLVEVLVSIGVVALLIGILVPALAKSMDKSKELGSSVKLRSLGQVFEMYAGRSDGMYPAPVPGKIYTTYAPDAGTTISHWQAAYQWHWLLSETHPWWEYQSMYLAPGAQRDDATGPVVTLPSPSFDYSASFLGHPSIWSGREIGPDEWPRLERGVTQSMVRFPASKGMMWDVEMPYLRTPKRHDDLLNLREKTPVLFADQHVASRVPAEATPAVFNLAPFASKPVQNIHNTPDGVFGMDY